MRHSSFHYLDQYFCDLMPGHSYFMANSRDELDLKWEYEVLPLLREYKKDGLISHNANPDKIGDYVAGNTAADKSESAADAQTA